MVPQLTRNRCPVENAGGGDEGGAEGGSVGQVSVVVVKWCRKAMKKVGFRVRFKW